MVRFDRIQTLPNGSFLLLGPRGTGKSTWVRRVLPDALRFDLLDEALYQDLLANPGRFAERLRTVSRDAWVVVDEVQRLPNLLNEVHRAIEDRGIRFALLGSSARKLRAQGTNLLAGRAVPREMFPLLPEELGTAFDMDDVLMHGSLPVVWSSADRGETLAAYARMYVREEIQAEALVRNLGGFARFLPLAALLHGQTINVAALARDAGAARTTVAGYLDVLEDTLLAFRLPAFEGRLRVRERRHPKLYLCDPGLARALKGSVREPPAPEERGALFEGWVAGLLRAYRHHRDLFDTWGWWAPSDAVRTEVDFVVTRAGRHVAIEAKAGTSGNADLAGLRAVAPLPGLVRRVCVSRREETGRTADGIELLGPRAFAALVSDPARFWTPDPSVAAP